MSSFAQRGQFDPVGWGNFLHSSEMFPSPFLDMASLSMPQNILHANLWNEYVASANETVRQAIERIVAYFLTDIEIGAISSTKELGDDEKSKFQDWFHRKNVVGFEQEMDIDRFVYGNAFCSVLTPFRRYLACPQCHARYPLRAVAESKLFGYRFSNFEFYATCPNCKVGRGYSGVWDVIDEDEASPDKIILKRWNIHHMVLLNDSWSGDVEYWWKIPEDYKQQVRTGKLYYLERAPKEVMKAIRNNQMYRFDPGMIYHMKEPTLGGIYNRGWGISRLTVNFRQIWYVQVLRRYNESIALDYIIPFRLITPAKSSTNSSGGVVATDMLKMVNAGDAMAQIRAMIRKRRRDPAGWNTLPFAVDYQALGGDAQNFAPSEMIDQGLQTMLNGLGVPQEMYQGSLGLQVAPVALRLFEANWHHLVYDNNAFLRWLIERLSKILSWEMVAARHRRVTHADDMQRQMALLQLMMGQTISKHTGLSSLGIDARDEARLIMQEAQTEQELQGDVQKQMDQTAYGQQIAQGAPPGGQPGQPMDPAAAQAQQNGQPMPPPGPVTAMFQGGGMPQTPEDMTAAAGSIANQLLGLPESQKDSELRMLKQKNELMHDAVVAKIKEIRQGAQRQGGAMMMAQTYGRT